jgi:hypothetical protein
MLAAFLFITQSSIASIWQDPNAMGDWSGRVDFGLAPASIGSLALNGHIDYAVYEPLKYDGSIDLYVYAYQVFNDSTVAINYFSVGLSPDVVASDAWCDPAMSWAKSGGCISPMALPLSESVLFVFQSGNIKAGKWSATLCFTSEDGPDMGKGVVSGGNTGGAIVDLPSPSSVPEPATLTLLGLGLALGLGKKRCAAEVTHPCSASSKRLSVEVHGKKLDCIGV